jgi:hypothetical protein
MLALITQPRPADDGRNRTLKSAEHTARRPLNSAIAVRQSGACRLLAEPSSEPSKVHRQDRLRHTAASALSATAIRMAHGYRPLAWCHPALHRRRCRSRRPTPRSSAREIRGPSRSPCRRSAAREAALETRSRLRRIRGRAATRRGNRIEKIPSHSRAEHGRSRGGGGPPPGQAHIRPAYLTLRRHDAQAPQLHWLYLSLAFASRYPHLRHRVTHSTFRQSYARRPPPGASMRTLLRAIARRRRTGSLPFRQDKPAHA